MSLTRVVLALEGGYSLEALSGGTQACVGTLLDGLQAKGDDGELAEGSKLECVDEQEPTSTAQINPDAGELAEGSKLECVDEQEPTSTAQINPDARECLNEVIEIQKEFYPFLEPLPAPPPVIPAAHPLAGLPGVNNLTEGLAALKS
eukprot:32227_1